MTQLTTLEVCDTLRPLFKTIKAKHKHRQVLNRLHNTQVKEWDVVDHQNYKSLIRKYLK
jgi:hypothetical protein